jgi:DNA repair protein RadC
MKVAYQSIPQWAEDDRPREKMMLKGKNALSDAELIAILIGTGTGSKSAVDLGRELLSLTNGDLYRFGQLRLAQLCEVKGIGESKAITILAALELGRRRKDMDKEVRVKINSSMSAYNEVKALFQDLNHEEFYALFLNKANEVLEKRQLSIGGTSGTVVDSKILFKAGIDCGASAMILAHNHPSGILKPSHEDVKLTKRLVQCGEIMEMSVLDHLILTDNGYFSFTDQGLI